MSHEQIDPNDANRHRNLLQIGALYSIPTQVDEDRKSRWQQTSLTADDGAIQKMASIARRHGNLKFLTSGAIAVVVTMIVWIGQSGNEEVSAAMIFANLKAVLGHKLTIHVEDIDLGNVEVAGEIVIDRNGPRLSSKTDTLYSELRFALKPDNSQWRDIAAAVVVCQSPEKSWVYHRGNGGASNTADPKRVVLSDCLVNGRPWQDFMADPLYSFGAMPIHLNFSDHDSVATYRFSNAQQTFVEQLFYYLVFNLGNAETSDRVIAQLRDSAGSVRVEQVNKSTWELRASDITQLGALQRLDNIDSATPDLDTTDVITTLTYDGDCQCIRGRVVRSTAPLGDLGVVVVPRTLPKLAMESAQALIAELEASYTVLKTSNVAASTWEIEVRGLPVELDTSEFEWQRDVLPKLMSKLELRVQYDASTDSITQAEFRGVGLDDGRIVLDLGRAELDPRRLEADAWIKGCTITEDELMALSPAERCNCTVVYERRTNE